MSFYIDKINQYIDGISNTKSRTFVLEAGCGSASRFNCGPNAFVTGVDISLKELHKNMYLDSKVLGDIQDVIFKPASFDIIVCCEVLEHVANPRSALLHFCKLLKDDGIAVIMVPNVLSLKGLATKFTPYRFHHWVYRKIYKSQKTPFPTLFRFSISPSALKKFAKEKKLLVEWTCYRPGWVRKLWDQSKLFYLGYIVLGTILKIVSFGMISISRTDFVIVYRKDKHA